ncbi:hypothetical protein [Hymenobacter sp. B81]|uniref:hypothetical protein n=1 Tax=Hymenobacter sp. B81 TaxID=3344878 RepID=UPI0037DDA0AB
MQDPELLAVRDALVQQAKSFLTEAGQFRPFGAGLRADGSMVLLGADEDDDAAPAERVTRLEQAIRAQLAAGSLRVGGIGVDVQLRFSADTPPTDALHLRLRRPDGYAVDYYMTYRLAEDRLICDPLIEDAGSFAGE